LPPPNDHLSATPELRAVGLGEIPTFVLADAGKPDGKRGLSIYLDEPAILAKGARICKFFVGQHLTAGRSTLAPARSTDPGDRLPERFGPNRRKRGENRP